jgi:hypothetical protein
MWSTRIPDGCIEPRLEERRREHARIEYVRGKEGAGASIHRTGIGVDQIAGIDRLAPDLRRRMSTSADR